MFSIDNYHKLYGQAKEHYIAEVQIDTNNAIRELLSFIKDQAKPALPLTGSTQHVDSLKPKLSVVKGSDFEKQNSKATSKLLKLKLKKPKKV